MTVVSTAEVSDTLGTFGVRTAVARMEAATKAAVFLSDENATVLDADGDPSNGMTPIATFDVDTHEAALAALGYQIGVE